MKRRWSVLILVLIAHFGCATGDDTSLDERTLLSAQLIKSWRALGISDRDQAEILRLSLQLAVVEGKICDMHLEREPKHLFVFSEAGVPIPLPSLDGVTFSYVTRQHIRHMHRTGRGLTYLKVEGEAFDSSHVVVNIERIASLRGGSSVTASGVFICSVTIELDRGEHGWSARSVGGAIA